MIRVAIEECGQTPEEWWAAQQRDVSRYAVEFQESVERGTTDQLPEASVVGGSRIVARRAVVAQG